VSSGKANYDTGKGTTVVTLKLIGEYTIDEILDNVHEPITDELVAVGTLVFSHNRES